MDVVGEIYRRRPGGQVYHIALGREHENLVGEHVYLEVVEEVRRVGILLAFQQAAHPCKLVLIPAFHGGAAVAHFILPVRRDAVLRRVVHFPRAYLHLERDALRADDRRVHALIHVRLRRGDIVLEAAGHGLEHIVYHAQHVVAVRYGIDDDAEGAQVENAVHVQVLRVHLAVDAVNMLYAAVYRGVYPLGVKALLYLRLHGGHELLQHRHLLVE